MKKFLSILLAASLIVATLIVVTIIPTAAVDGDWSVYADKSQYADDYAGIMGDIPGYEYTEEGLKMIPAPWKDSTPYATFQTTEPVSLKEGVYLQVRVDQMSYDAGDRWFGFSIWDQQNVELGKQGDDYGYGVETLIRHNGLTKNATTGEFENAKYKEGDPSTYLGAMASLEWYSDLEEGQRLAHPNSANNKLYEYTFEEVKDEEGNVVDYLPILTLEIVWDAASETYAISINGVPAPDAYNQAATDYFADLDDQAYIGFSIQNNKLGGTVGCTILKWGTDAETAEAPVGDDDAEPEIFANEAVEIMDPSTVEVGAPAIVLNGSRSDSDVAGKPSSVMGNKIVVNDDTSVNLQASKDNSANIKFLVDNTVSYDVKDFPYVIVITKNFCTCTYQDEDMDGVLEEYCKCTEQINTLALAGNLIQEDSSHSAKSLALTYWDPYYVGDDFYHYFIMDWSGIADLEGRIHGLRLDFAGLKGNDPARNNFDICEIAFFRTADEATAFFEEYLNEIGGSVTPGPGTDPGTQPGTDPGTQPGTDPGTTPDTEPGSTTSGGDTVETESKPVESGDKSEGGEKKGGCGSVVGVGAIAVVALAAAGLVSFKKKED